MATSTLRERLYSKVEKTATCWFWKGCVSNINGFGTIKIKNKQSAVHRVVWLLEKSEKPGTLQVKNICSNKLCVNPDHLYLSTEESRFWRKVKRGDGCWIWTGAKRGKKYGAIRFRGKSWSANRVAWILTNGEIPNGLFVCHHCDTPLCCRPDHLFLGTNQDNMDDMNAKGRGARGETHGFILHPEKIPRGEKRGTSKLTDNSVREIRNKFSAGGISKMDLAREYKVDHTTIRSVISRKNWKHIE